MRTNSWRCAVLSLVFAGPAAAQVIWDVPGSERPGRFNGLPETKARPDVWPRLDPGAALCRSEDDLLRLAAHRRGETVTPPNCRVVRQAYAVTIVRRAGPGRTQVALTDQNGQEGWTDAWLPEKPPVIGGRGATIR